MKPNLHKVSTNFSRGLDLSASHLIDPNECQIAENFLFDKNVAYVRQGTAVNASLPYPVVALKKFYKNNGSSFFVGFAGGQLYNSATSGTFQSVSSEPISGDIQTAIYNDNMYFTNYSTVTKYFNGSSIDFVGLSSPIFRKQIEDFESPLVWWTAGSGSIVQDNNYTHIDLGNNAIQLTSFDPLNGTSFFISGYSHWYNLMAFAPNVASTSNDLIQFYGTHAVKNNIRNCKLIFWNNNGNTASLELTNTSAWVSCSTDFYGQTYTIPKSNFTMDFGSFAWGSCYINLQLYPTSNGINTAIMSFDNIRMVKTPPMLTMTYTSATSSTLFFGSSITWTQFPNEWVSGGVQTAWYSNNQTLSPSYKETQQGLQLQGTTISGAPLVNDTYYYKVTFVKQGPNGIEIESNPCFATSGIAISSNTSTWQFVQLTDIPLAPAEWGVAGRNIYRRPQSDSYYRYVYTLANNSTTTFLDKTPYTVLGRNLEEDHWPPPQAKFIFAASNQQMYYFNIIEEGNPRPSRLRWSKPYEPHYCPINNVLDVSPADGMAGTGMFEYLTLLHVLKERSTWIIDESGNLKGVNDSVGCVAPFSIAKGENEVFWLSEQGIIKYNLQFRNITKERNRMDAIIQRLPVAYIPQARGIFYNGFYLLAVTDAGSTVNNLVLVYDNINDKWSTFPNTTIGAWTAWQAYKDGYRLFLGNNSGMVNEFLTGNYDISTPIYSHVRSKEFGRPSPTTAFRKAYFHIQELDGGNRQYQITPFLDFYATSADYQTTSGVYSMIKTVFPALDGASFCSMEVISSGRYQINQLDLEGKEEEER